MKNIISRVTGFIHTIQYELAIFCFLLLRGLPTADFSGVAGWQTMSYVLSYKQGFSSRLLIGSLMQLLCPDGVSARSAALLVNITVIIDCLLVALALGALLRAAEKRGQLMLAALPTVLYLALPINFSIYFSSAGHAGKLEIFLLPIMLLSAWLLLCTKPGIKQTAALSVLSILAMLIYQNYIFLCFPLIFALLIYNLFKFGWNRSNIINSLAICFVNGAFFLYLQLFAKLNVTDPELLTAQLQAQTDMVIVGDAVFYEYFASFSEFFVDLMLNRYDYQFETLMFDLMLLSPVIAVFIYIWITAFRACSAKNDRLLLCLMQLSSAVFLPTYIITCDWARWTVWYVLFQTAIVLVMWYRQFTPMVTALEKAAALAGRFKPLAALLVVYLLSLTSDSVTEIFVISKTLQYYFFEYLMYIR